MKKKPDFRFLLTFVVGIVMSLSAAAQQITVRGHVKDQTGEPVVYASVTAVDTKTVVNTDSNGDFTLKAAKGTNLRISLIGYNTVVVKADAEMNITLEDSGSLDEAVVVGYTKVKKSDATGSVTAIKPDEMSKGITTNAQDMLVGKVPGVSVVTGGGQPGAGATIRVRGGSSLSASNDPLIVIDGLAMDNDGVQGLSNPLAMVNPDDIESFTILKDASATAIYGSRASNGVIIITTKKGRKNARPTVTYNGNVSFGTTRKTYDLLTGDQFRDYVTNLYGDALPAPLGTANTNWQDQIYQTAVSHDHNVSINGGLGFLPYRLSFGYTNQQGIIKTTDFERYTVALNLAPTFFDEHLAVNLNAKVMTSKNRYADVGGALGAAISMDPTRPVYFEEGNPDAAFTGGYYQQMIDGSFSDPTWNRLPNTKTTGNPLAILNLRNQHAKSFSTIGNIELDYKVHGFEDLHIHANLGGDYSEGNEWTVISPYSFSHNYYGWDGRAASYKYNLQGNLYAQYQHVFGEHNVDVMLGAEQQHFHRRTFSEGQGTDSYTGEAYSPSYRKETAYATRNSLVSYFGRFNYIFRDRYLFTFTMRFDGSSRFSKDNRWGKFPALALGWKLKEENFLKDVNWLSDLKLRLGWGITGQQNLPVDFYYVPLFNQGDSYAQYPFGGTYYPTMRPNVYNPDLTWEKTTTWNAGIDYSFLGGRIDGALDFYVRNTDDLLSYVDIATGTNFSDMMYKNIGSLRNTGLEFSVNARPIMTKDFTWQLTYNVMWNKNEITDLYGESGQVMTGATISRGGGNQVQVNRIGCPANSFYVYQQVYDENGKPLENVFVDRNGNGHIDEGDKYVYKKPDADVLMSLTSKFLYKNWDLSFTLRASLNNYVYFDYLSDKCDVSTTGMYSNAAYSNRTPMHLALGWSGVGDGALSDYFVRNASFLRCDNITLGYSFQNLFAAKKYEGINGRVYFTVQNPFVITKYDGLDPEINTGGVDKGFYPRPTTYMIGLNLQF